MTFDDSAHGLNGKLTILYAFWRKHSTGELQHAAERQSTTVGDSCGRQGQAEVPPAI
jgi:hypothetical protein